MPADLPAAIAAAFVTPFDAQSHLTTIVQPAADHADLVLVGDLQAQAGCADGRWRKLDWGKIGGRERLIAGAAGDCGVGALVQTTVLAWDRDKVQGAPHWGEFWDVAKLPGKRGLRRGVRDNLEIALLADGVAPADIYATLRGDQGVERAFRKLDQLKPYVVWWDSEDDALRLLTSGDVLLTSAPANAVLPPRAVPSHVIAVQWAGGIETLRSWVVPTAATHPDAALRFLAFTTDPKIARGLADTGPWGPTSAGALDGLPADKLWPVPTAPANLAAGLMVDETFWHDNEARLGKLYDSWMTK